MEISKIKPMYGRILVQMIDRYADYANPAGLTLVDKQKHWEGKTRRGKVVRIGEGVHIVSLGDVVIFEACEGFTLDGEAIDADNPIKGNDYRWMKEKHLMAVEEPIPQEAA